MRLLLLAIGLSTALFASGASAALAKLRFDTAKAKYGLVIVETEAPVMLAPYHLDIVRLEGSKLKYGPLHGWLNLIKLGEGQTGRRYYLAKADPSGLYVFQKLGVSVWSACFNGGTKAFEVGPGQIVFAGRIDPNPAMSQMMTELPPVTLNYKPQTLFDTPRPTLTPPSELPGWEEEVRAFLARDYPNVTGAPVAAELKDVTFDKDRTLDGVSCDRY